jgi:porphobilinogen synthase
MPFPIQRLRRLRETEPLRRMVRETSLTPNDFIYPVFVTEGQGRREPIVSMPGQSRLSIDLLVKEAHEVKALGIPAMILFGIPDRKDERGSSGFDPEGIVQRAIRAVKAQVPDLVLITDVCIDEYTSHGHCGIVRDGKILNDETLDCLRTMAKTHAQAGADMVAPSDMMDGRVAAIRDELDCAGFVDIPIMAYAAKFASCFYAPFRDAANSSPQFGDRPVLSDGSGEQAGSLAGDRLGYRGGGRHHHGEARHAVFGHHQRRARTDASADCRLPGERGIQHDQSGGTSRLVG